MYTTASKLEIDWSLLDMIPIVLDRTVLWEIQLLLLGRSGCEGILETTSGILHMVTVSGGFSGIT